MKYDGGRGGGVNIYVINSITQRFMVDTKIILNCYTGLEYNNTQTQVGPTNSKGKSKEEQKHG